MPRPATSQWYNLARYWRDLYEFKLEKGEPATEEAAQYRLSLKYLPKEEPHHGIES
jgi:hypothetical protein